MTVERATLNVAANGRVVIPAAMREQLGIQGGGKLIARVVDGALVLETREAAVRRSRALVAKYVREGDDIVAELIAERRAEAARE